jgi:hypothetical protein
VEDGSWDLERFPMIVFLLMMAFAAEETPGEIKAKLDVLVKDTHFFVQMGGKYPTLRAKVGWAEKYMASPKAFEKAKAWTNRGAPQLILVIEVKDDKKFMIKNAWIPSDNWGDVTPMRRLCEKILDKEVTAEFVKKIGPNMIKAMDIHFAEKK